MLKKVEKLMLVAVCMLLCGCTNASAHSGEATLAVTVVDTTADGKQATEKITVAKTEKKKEEKEEKNSKSETKDNATLATGSSSSKGSGSSNSSKSNSTSSNSSSSSNSNSNSNTGSSESSGGGGTSSSSDKSNTTTTTPEQPSEPLPTTPTPAPAPEPEPAPEDPYVVTSWYSDPSVADIEAYLVANGFDTWMTNHKTFAVSEYGSFDSVMSAKKSFYGNLNEYSQGDSTEIYLYFDHEKGVILSSCPMDNRIYRDGIGYVDFLNAGVITCTANVLMYN